MATLHPLVEWSIQVCQEYREKGYLLTLRQLYYQGVARKRLPSGQKSYKHLMDVLSTARERGTFPLWALVDRTRRVHPGEFTRNDANVDRALDRAAREVQTAAGRLLGRGRWFAQDVHLSVWFEKEALAGIFEGVCAEEGVTCFSIRGDPSHPALYEWLQHAAAVHGVGDASKGWRDQWGQAHSGRAKRSIVLYFGDHDPTGIRIPRSAEITTRIFMGHMGLTFPLEFRRVGITLDQARALDLPPFPAKESAGKDYESYVAEFDTTDAWELDALSPETLEDLVRQECRKHFDGALFERLRAGTDERRAQMTMRLRDPAWHRIATRIEED